MVPLFAKRVTPESKQNGHRSTKPMARPWAGGRPIAFRWRPDHPLQEAQVAAVQVAQALVPPRDRLSPPFALLTAAKSEMVREVFVPPQRGQAMGSSACPMLRRASNLVWQSAQRYS